MSPVVLMLLFFGAVCVVLARYQLALAIARDEREADLLEQLAQPGDLMSPEVAASQLTLQVKDDQGGITVGAALAAHESQSAAVYPFNPRGTEAKGAQTL